MSYKWKQNTFFHFTIPAVEPTDKDKKFLKIFKETFIVLTKVVDNRTIILPISGVSEHHNEAILDVTHLANIHHLGQYIEHLLIKSDQPTTFKLFLGYNKASINFTSDQLAAKLIKLGLQVKLCNIQSAKVSCVGWVIESSPKQDSQLYVKLYSNHPKVMNYNIDCKIDLVKMSLSEKYTRETVTRAIFIYIDKKSHKAVKKGLKGVYNKPRLPHHQSTSYPDGRVMKLVSENFVLATSILLTQDHKLKFIWRKNIK